MSCGNDNNSCCKSVACFYNDVAQTFAADATTPLIISGNRVVLNGKGIDVFNNGYTILKSGIYRISGDVVVTGSAAGLLTFQVYLDGLLLPCTVRKKSITSCGTTTIHTETIIDFDKVCPCTNNVNHRIVFALVTDAAAAGTVDNLCTGVTKLD